MNYFTKDSLSYIYIMKATTPSSLYIQETWRKLSLYSFSFKFPSLIDTWGYENRDSGFQFTMSFPFSKDRIHVFFNFIENTTDSL